MIYSRSAEYAIRAFVHLAQVPEGKYAMVKNIAEQEQIPAHFLAKDLAAACSQRSAPLQQGSHRAASPCAWTPPRFACSTLSRRLDGLAPFQQCASGLAECNDGYAVLHAR